MSTITMKLIKNPFIIKIDISNGPNPSNHIDFSLKIVMMKHKNENKLSFMMLITLSFEVSKGLTMLKNMSVANWTSENIVHLAHIFTSLIATNTKAETNLLNMKLNVNSLLTELSLVPSYNSEKYLLSIVAPSLYLK